MKKLLEISQDIPEDKQIEHKFEIKSSVFRIFGQEIAIQSQNVVSCIEILIGYPGFQYNQTYEPYHIYNQNKNRVYNKIYAKDWWQK